MDTTKIELTEAEINIVIRGLLELQGKYCYDVITKILNAQLTQIKNEKNVGKDGLDLELKQQETNG